MPGMLLTFTCPCGFKKENIEVGATEKGHFKVAICLQCRKIFSIWVNYEQERHKPEMGRTCQRCGMDTILITDPGAWIPISLQTKFNDTEPWMVEDTLCEHEEITEEDITNIQNIRVLCPSCRAHSVEYHLTGCWD
jgi:transposase-like protein